MAIIKNGLSPERMVTMLPISSKMKRLGRELNKAIGILVDVNEVLKYLEKGDNLTEKVGCFLTNPSNPKFTILFDDSHEIADILRKVCSGEKTPNEASEKIEKALKELQIIQRGIYHMEDEIRKG